MNVATARAAAVCGVRVHVCVSVAVCMCVTYCVHLRRILTWSRSLTLLSIASSLFALALSGGQVDRLPFALTIETKEEHVGGQLSNLHPSTACIHPRSSLPIQMFHSFSFAADLDLSALLKSSAGSPSVTTTAATTTSVLSVATAIDGYGPDAHCWAPVR